uniref:hypothetical protein n=1 Tax=uncultured Serinicoccus sp. TaxID=735514 RepID=UPI002615FFD6
PRPRPAHTPETTTSATALHHYAGLNSAGIVWVAGDVLNELACHREGKRLVREDPDVLSYRCDPLVFGVYRLWLRLYI